MIINIFVELQENMPLQRTIIQNSLALVPSNMVHESGNCSIRLREIADKLYALNKITAQASDNSKIQIGDLLKIAFLKLRHKKDHLNEFIWPLLMKLSDSKELYTMCKAICYNLLATVLLKETFL